MKASIDQRLAIVSTIAWLCFSNRLLSIRESSIGVQATPIVQNKFRLAFAASPARGGFGSGGGGGGGGKSSTKRNNKGKSKKKTKRGSILSEVQQVVSNPPKPPPTSSSEGPKLDKWGLPIPTTDDIFPPMPPGTELIPVDTTKDDDFTLADITSALKDHIELNNLQLRFDEKGVEKHVHLSNRKPMKLRLLHQSPPVLAIDNFFTKEECDQVKQIALSSEEEQAKASHNGSHHASGRGPVQVQSATFSAALSQSKRTSTSWFCYYSQVPTLLAKAYHVLGIPTLEQMEEPQIVRYKTGQEFSWHYDEVPAPQLGNGGQRLATLLVYLNDVADGAGGGTVFRDLKSGITRKGDDSEDDDMLTMKPHQGSALLFFPAFGDGRPDDRTLHKGEVVAGREEKWIIQMWIHEKPYVASIPPGNFQESAKDEVDRVSEELGYQQ